MHGWRQMVTYLACFLAIGVSTVGWLHGDTQIKHEGAERRSATCVSFEADHLAEVNKLREEYLKWDRTYKVLHTKEKTGNRVLDALIEQQIPDLRSEVFAAQRDALDDQDKWGVYVPSYCDEPGVGLPEPDPVIPPAPPTLLP